MEMQTMDFEESPMRQQSFLMWIFSALGARYTLLLPAAAALSFVLVLILLLRGKDRTLGPCLVLIVPLPLLVGIYAFFDGLIASLQVISATNIAPKPSEIIQGLAMSLVAPWLAMFLAFPAYLLAVVGLLIRTLAPERHADSTLPPLAGGMKSR